MSIEFDNPTNLAEMKQITSEWIYHRPTIHHTKETLQRVRQAELNELYEAVILKRPPNEIAMEVGDVLFSTLALDENPNTKTTNDYKFFELFANVHDLSLVGLFKLTHYKNRVNYPITFFNKMSPFENANDAISCLRILRTANNNNSKELDDLWFESDILVNEQQPCFFRA